MGLSGPGWDSMAHLQGNIRSKKVEKAALHHIS